VAHAFGHPVFWVAVDPNNPNRGYASVANHSNATGAAGGVYRCDNLNSLGSSTWTKTPSPPRTQGHPASLVVLNDGKLVATFSARDTTAFSLSSGCFLYDPTAGTWTDVSAPGMKYYSMDVVVDPHDALQNTWYVGVFGGWGGAPNNLGGLYKTTNRGTSWTCLTNFNIIHDVTSCTLNPTNANELYLTTQYNGLWISDNINASTPTFTQVANYPFEQPERVFFNPFNSNEIWVSSFGNGMKMGTLAPSSVHELKNEPEINIYPNPSSSGMFTVRLGETVSPVEMEVFNIFGQVVHKGVLVGGLNDLNLSHLSPAVYFVRIAGVTRQLVISN
jgi:hypothetical protein